MTDKDYSLLRPFDLDAAKRGEPICTRDGSPAKFIAHVPEATPIFDRVIVLCVGKTSNLYHCNEEARISSLGGPIFCMTPLAWLEGKPVYKGDKVWCKLYSETVTVSGSLQPAMVIATGHEAGLVLDVRDLTWSAPAPKTKTVKLLAYLDADQLFWLREGAQSKFPAVRIPSEDKTVEIEAPA